MVPNALRALALDFAEAAFRCFTASSQFSGEPRPYREASPFRKSASPLSGAAGAGFDAGARFLRGSDFSALLSPSETLGTAGFVTGFVLALDSAVFGVGLGLDSGVDSEVAVVFSDGASGTRVAGAAAGDVPAAGAGATSCGAGFVDGWAGTSLLATVASGFRICLTPR
jgi:hypothetical protein